MFHRMFNISTGNVEVDSKFPTETGAFLGLDAAKNVEFHSTGETEFVSLLLDGNRTIYPLAKDSTPSADSIKDPQWVDLPPIGAVGEFDDQLDGELKCWIERVCLETVTFG